MLNQGIWFAAAMTLVVTACTPGFDIVSRLEDQRTALNAKESCSVASTPANSVATPPTESPISSSRASLQLTQLRRSNFGNPGFASHVLGGTLAERTLANRLSKTPAAQLFLSAPTGVSANPIQQAQATFIEDPVRTRDLYLEGLGALGQEEFVKIAANALLMARAHNLGKLGVVPPDASTHAAETLQRAGPSLSTDTLKRFAANKTDYFMPTIAIPSSPAAPAPPGGPTAPTGAPPAPPPVWQELGKYYAAYYSDAGFILRDGTKLTRSQITGTTIPSQMVINSETILLEFLADYLLQTPIFWDPTTKTYYPAGNKNVPTATTIISPLQVSSSADCGVDIVKAQAINLLADAASDETLALSAPVLESLSSIHLGVVVAGINFAIGDATTLQAMAKTFIETITRRGVYALATDVFMAAKTTDLNPFLTAIVGIFSTNQQQSASAANS